MKRRVFIGAALVLVVGLIVGLIVLQKSKDNSQEPDVPESSEVSLKDEKTGLKLSYKDPLQEGTVTAEDTEAKIIWRLESISPPALVTVKYEEGLRVATTLSKQELLPMLLANADKTFPLRYKNYKLESKNTNFKVKDKKAAELVFSYDGPSGERAKQRLWIIDIDGNTAVYVAAQAQSKEYDTVNSYIFDPLFYTLSF